MVFVLPSKRAGIFLKHDIASFTEKPIFSPKIYSIEELVVEISGLENAPNLTLVLELYEAFKLHSKTQQKSFESFIAWGNTLLADFNEIDRNLVDQTSLFDYLTANQRLKNWGSDKKATPLISETIAFWGQLNAIYETLQSRLLAQGVGYQGLIYKEAVNKITDYVSHNTFQHYHFIGFNALNTAEEYIFNSFLTNKNATIWWDTDSYFLGDNIHEAGFFIRNYLKKWPQTKTSLKPQSSFLTEKDIQIIGVPKSVSQAKFIGSFLENRSENASGQNTALVLSDETLLPPILNSIPQKIEKINITMGLPLRKTTLYDFFDALLDLHLKKSKNGWFYKDVDKVLTNPYCIGLLQTSGENIAIQLNSMIREENILLLTEDVLARAMFSKSTFLGEIFPKKSITSKDFIQTCLHFIEGLKKLYKKSDQQEFHQLYGFFQLFNRLDTILHPKPYLNSLKALKFLFNELVTTEQIDFKGEPLGGLQIMGVLESRNLDFDTVILTSVNEGILPAGKNQNSFIPYDIKKEFGMPTHKEKDAIYAYHFYRLLQRAKNIHILYNTEPDVLLGNEKSRFISQLLTDPTLKNYVTHTIAAPEIKIHLPQPKEILKTQKLMAHLEEVSYKGFSPSSLTNYIKNPYEFYKSNVLRIKDVDDIEENIAYNTFGTIVHDSLEQLYLPLVGHKIDRDNLIPLKQKIKSVTASNFEKHFPVEEIKNGQNLIVFHVIQKYLSSLIDFDISRTTTNEIVLLALEKNLKTKISVPEYPHPVYLKGKLDRMEKVNGILQILDYKTGNVLPSEVEITALEECISNEKRSKAFQLLCYALMEYKENNSQTIQAGIVPVKSISSGIFSFAQKGSARGSKNYIIDATLMENFEKQLGHLILEILNPDIPFTERF